MATPPAFADIDTSQSDLMQSIVADVSKRYTDNMMLESAVQQDKQDKLYSQKVLDSYMSALNPRKETRVHPTTGASEQIEKYPTVDEIYRVSTQARAQLAQSGGRHSVFAAEQIGKDLDARLKYSQRASKVDELQRYIDLYGEEMGLSKFNEAQVARKVAPVEAKGRADVATEEKKQEGRKEMEGVKFGYRLKLEGVKAEKAFSPVELDNGNLAIAWHNPITHEAGTYDLGVKGSKLGAKNAGKKITTNEWFKVWQPVIDAEMRAVSMKHSEEQANKGIAKGPNDTNLLFNHMGMTLSAQKGTRITYAEIQNAITARSFPADLMAKWDMVSTGGFLSPEQRKYFVDLAMKRRYDFVQAARRSATAIKMDKSQEPAFNPELPQVPESESGVTGGTTEEPVATPPQFDLKAGEKSYKWDAEDSESFKKDKGHYPTQAEAEAEAKAHGVL